MFYGSHNRRNNFSLARQFSNESQQPFVQPGNNESCESSLTSKSYVGNCVQNNDASPQLLPAFNRLNNSESNSHQQFIFVNKKLFFILN